MEESDFEKAGQFSIKVRVGNAEIAVSAPDKDFVLNESKYLIEQFRLNGVAPHSTEVEIVQGEVMVLPAMSQTRVVKPQTLGGCMKKL